MYPPCRYRHNLCQILNIFFPNASHVSVCLSLCLGRGHVAIAHAALDLTVHPLPAIDSQD